MQCTTPNKFSRPRQRGALRVYVEYDLNAVHFDDVELVATTAQWVAWWANMSCTVSYDTVLPLLLLGLLESYQSVVE